MPIIEKFNFSQIRLNQTIQQNENKTAGFDSKISDYFDYIYTYPPKLHIKWSTVDDLNEDPLKKVRHNHFSFDNLVQDSEFENIGNKATSKKYTLSQYTEGYLSKIASSNFFDKKTKTIQAELANIPIYVILNGQKEIVLSKPSNFLGSKNIKTFFAQTVYDQCGSFDKNIEKKQQLGLFFLNRLDAENYLQEIARLDVEGTQTVGLSLHCTSLKSAYKVTREYHPGVDFRFVPKLEEIKNLLENNISKADTIIENEQHQIRFRKRGVNVVPSLGKLGQFIMPSFSFLQKDEYFKGVPIYIVQLSDTSQNIITKQYFNFINKIDGAFGRVIQLIDQPTGFGHNWVMEGSLEKATGSTKFTNYVFFEKTQAEDFIKQEKKNIASYIGSRTIGLKSLSPLKPKIFLYNLEDFLEDFEDKVWDENFKEDKGQVNSQKTALTDNTYNLITPSESFTDLIEFKENYQRNMIKDFGQILNLKSRMLKRFIGVFFSVR
jgi:hypothetical protein